MVQECSILQNHCVVMHLPLDSSVQCQWPIQGQNLSVIWHWLRSAAAVCTEQIQRRRETSGAVRRYDVPLFVLAAADTGTGRSSGENTIKSYIWWRPFSFITTSQNKVFHIWVGYSCFSELQYGQQSNIQYIISSPRSFLTCTYTELRIWAGRNWSISR